MRCVSLTVGECREARRQLDREHINKSSLKMLSVHAFTIGYAPSSWRGEEASSTCLSMYFFNGYDEMVCFLVLYFGTNVVTVFSGNSECMVKVKLSYKFRSSRCLQDIICCGFAARSRRYP